MPNPPLNDNKLQPPSELTGETVELFLLPDQQAAHRYMQALMRALIALPKGAELSDEQYAELWQKSHQ